MEKAQAGSRVILSKSSLARYEAGQLPPLRYATHLSELYGGAGWLEVAVRGLWMSDWNPWATEDPAKVHLFAWPAAYAGLVWIYLRPGPHNVAAPHNFRLHWGPWRCEQHLILPEEGVVLITGKHKDEGAPVSCMTSSDHSFHLLHGVGGGGPKSSIDISRLWQ